MSFGKGSKGREVELVQTALARLGLYGPAIDGLFGDGTEDAVRGFQSERGLVADGVVGPATWAALGLPTAATGTPAHTTRFDDD